MIVVSGAAGFLGRSVCAQLQRENLPYAGIDIDACSGVEVCDIADAGAVRRLFRRSLADSVIHLAAMLPSACRADPVAATRVNIDGSVNLIEAAAAAGTRRFVFGSSMSVYGTAEDGTPVDEEMPACPRDLYGAAKRYVELLGEAALGASFAALRIATVVGLGVRRTASPWRSGIFEKSQPEIRRPIRIPYPETAVLSLVHVEDVARMLILLATRDHLSHLTYNSPAENWTAGELQRVVEALDPEAAVELDPACGRGAPPVSGGARFVRDFAWRAPSLADRLAEALKRTC